jgi:hypothetical protein
MTMVQATDDDAMTADNVRPIRPDVTPEPQPRRERRKDHRAAARKAKSRCKNNIHRDTPPTKSALPAPHVGAPPIAPLVTQAARNGVATPREASGSPGRGEPAHVRLNFEPDTYTPEAAEHRRIDRLTLLAALALATVSAGFSIYGFTSIFVGAFWSVIGMGAALELGKLRAVTWIGRNASAPWWGLKGALAVLVLVLMGLNVVGAFGFLAKAHIGHQVEGETVVSARTADIEGRLAVQAEKVADITKQITDLDAARTIETPSAGNLRTASAISARAAALAAAAKLRAADDERRQAKRNSLADKLTIEAKALAEFKIEKAKVDGDRKVAEADLGPVRYLATLLSAGDQDVLRWFILVVAVLLDPAAVLLLLAATRR